MVVKNAFQKDIAEDLVECAWRELEDQGIMQDDPSTWEKGPYTRTGGPPNVGIMASRGDKQAQAEMDEVRGKYGLKQEWASGVREPQHVLQDMAPRALGAQLDAVGGWDRVHEPELVELPTGLAVNLCGGDGGEDWRSTQVGGWHKGEAVPVGCISSL